MGDEGKIIKLSGQPVKSALFLYRRGGVLFLSPFGLKMGNLNF